MCLSVIFQHETCYYCGALRFGSSQKFLFTNFELTKSQTCWCFLLIPVCTQLDRSYRNKNLAFLCFKGTLVLFTASRIRALVFPLIHVCCAQLDRQQSSRDKADEGNSGVGCLTCTIVQVRLYNEPSDEREAGIQTKVSGVTC